MSELVARAGKTGMTHTQVFIAAGTNPINKFRRSSRAGGRSDNIIYGAQTGEITEDIKDAARLGRVILLFDLNQSGPLLPLRSRLARISTMSSFLSTDEMGGDDIITAEDFDACMEYVRSMQGSEYGVPPSMAFSPGEPSLFTREDFPALTGPTTKPRPTNSPAKKRPGPTTNSPATSLPRPTPEQPTTATTQPRPRPSTVVNQPGPTSIWDPLPVQPAPQTEPLDLSVKMVPTMTFTTSPVKTTKPPVEPPTQFEPVYVPKIPTKNRFAGLKVERAPKRKTNTTVCQPAKKHVKKNFVKDFIIPEQDRSDAGPSINSTDASEETLATSDGQNRSFQ